MAQGEVGAEVRAGAGQRAPDEGAHHGALVHGHVSWGDPCMQQHTPQQAQNRRTRPQERPRKPSARGSVRLEQVSASIVFTVLCGFHTRGCQL